MLEALMRSPVGLKIARRISAPLQTIHAPHLLDLEIAQGLRRCVLSGQISRSRAEEALQDFARLRVRRYPHAPLLARVWELHGNVTAYDAVYIALAESLETTLITCDRRLAGAPGNQARIQLV